MTIKNERSDLMVAPFSYTRRAERLFFYALRR
nr:MAG TPA: hypothetical protein [Bacteriophage sp.]